MLCIKLVFLCRITADSTSKKLLVIIKNIKEWKWHHIKLTFFTILKLFCKYWPADGPLRQKIVPNTLLVCFLIIYFFLARQPSVGQGLLIHEVSGSHTTTHHSRKDSSGRVISSSQRPLPENTQHSQQTDIHASVGFKPTISADERP